VRTLHFTVRSEMPPRALTRTVRDLVAAVDSQLPAFAIRSGHDLLHTAIAAQRFNLLVVGVFSLFAVTLALSGLYAVLLHTVEQTRRECGIRMALGATGGRVIRTVGRLALVPTLAGIAAGTAGAAAASGLISSLLFAVKPSDPVTLAASASLILMASIVAILIPASKAARADLVTLLRHE
jgi:ABC-type antimicrobial peptide transport system permease subunit